MGHANELAPVVKMICLSKADEGTFNQSPRPLAASSTTREDLNGIANLREHVASGQNEDDAGGGTVSSADDAEKWYHQGTPPGDDTCHGGRGDSVGHEQSHGLSVSRCRERATGGDDQSGLLKKVTDPACLARLWGWCTWVASVLLMSFFLTFLFAPHTTTTTREVPTPAATHSVPVPAPSAQGNGGGVLEMRKRSTCTANGVDSAEYNMPLHVGALMIIWFVSTTACAFPLLAKKFPGLHIPPRFSFVIRHFGTGVLIATAFVHLLPTAFVSLGDPCLGSFWVSDYPAMPGAISLASIFFVTVIEMVFHPARRCTSVPTPSAPQEGAMTAGQSNDPATTEDPQALPMCDMAPPKARTSSVGHGLNQLSVVEETRASEEGDVESGRDSIGEESPALKSLPELKLPKERLQCVLLELGILFHSIFIGMALSVSVGNEFIVLLIAITFHQTFEGLALGARISMVKWPESYKYQPWLMALAYGCTTPLGQAIGLATHTLYSPDSEIGLIVVGVMNSISAGLLVFASLVELMAEDFLSDDSWRVLRGRKRVMACVIVFLGAFCMSLVGAWA